MATSEKSSLYITHHHEVDLEACFEVLTWLLNRPDRTEEVVEQFGEGEGF